MHIQCYLEKHEIFKIKNIKARIALTAKKLNLPYRETHISSALYRVDFDYKNMSLAMYARDFKVNGNNRGGLIKRIKSKTRKGPCFIPFTHIYIDYNGCVVPCCNIRSDITDHKKFILGNVKDENIFEIFNNESIQKLRKILITNDIKLRPCNKCSFALGHMV